MIQIYVDKIYVDAIYIIGWVQRLPFVGDQRPAPDSGPPKLATQPLRRCSGHKRGTHTPSIGSGQTAKLVVTLRCWSRRGTIS